jgi:hypothetical protein
MPITGPKSDFFFFFFLIKENGPWQSLVKFGCFEDILLGTTKARKLMLIHMYDRAVYLDIKIESIEFNFLI